MSEHDPGIGEQLESELDFLRIIQAQHASDLETEGILPKVLLLCPEALSSPNTRICLALNFDALRNGGGLRNVSVRFTATHLDAEGKELESNRDVIIAEPGENGLVPFGELDKLDLIIVMEMVEGLQTARELGVLPNLTQDLASIDSPVRGMIYMPPDVQ